MKFAEPRKVHDQALALRDRYDRGDPDAADAIHAALDRYKFYHSIEVVPGLSTSGLSAQGHAWAQGLVDRIIGAMRGLDFGGTRVLDVGCRDGALSFAAEQFGAAEVVGIDNDLSPGLTEFLIPFKRSRVRAFELNVNELAPERFGQFDIVLFAGVLYHLRYPMWALRRIVDVLKPGGTLLIESAFIEGFADFPIIFCPSEKGQPYEASCVSFFNAAGLDVTLGTLGFSDIEWFSSHAYSSRHYTIRVFARAFPRFVVRNWWRMPRICRKIAIAKRGDPHALAGYWDASHRWHSGS